MSYLGIKKKISTSNSSTAALSGAATYTGTWEEISNFSTITVICTTNVAGTLYVDFSSNGTDSDRTAQLSSGNASDISGIHSLTCVAKYFRVRIINGAGAQSYLRLQSILHQSAKIAIPTSRLGQNIGQYSDVMNVRVSNDVDLDTSRGVLGGRSVIDVEGRNTAVSTSEVVVTRANVAFTGFLTTAATIRVKSGGNANDTAAGSGARSVTIEGLDPNFNVISETITTNGASASSPTSESFIRVSKVFVATSGTYSDGITGGNTGDINIETSGGVLITLVAAGLGQSQMAVYTVPAGKTGYITSFDASVESTKTATVRLYKRENSDDSTVPVNSRQLLQTFSGLSGEGSKNHKAYISLPAKSDIWITATKDSAGTTSVDASIEIILIDN